MRLEPGKPGLMASSVLCRLIKSNQNFLEGFRGGEPSIVFVILSKAAPRLLRLTQAGFEAIFFKGAIKNFFFNKPSSSE